MTTTEKKHANGRVYTATYGFHKIGNQLPYFSMQGEDWTAESWKRHEQGSSADEPEVCGCMHEMIGEQFPHLRELIPFHLCDSNGVPMHYFANGMHWHKIATGRIARRLYFDPERDTVAEGSKQFLRHVRQGDVEGDDAKHWDAVFKFSDRQANHWLGERLARIAESFRATMAEHGVKVPAVEVEA